MTGPTTTKMKPPTHDQYPYVHYFIDNAQLIGGGVVHFPMDSFQGGQVEDRSGNDHDGTVFGNAETTAGKVGQGIRFDGIDDVIEVANAPALSLRNAVTASAWVYLEESAAAVQRVIHGGENTWGLFVKKNSAYFYVDSSDDGGARRTVSSPIPLRQWVHLAGVYSGTKLSLYVNGNVVAEALSSRNINISGDALTIGGNPPRQYFTGMLDDIRIHDIALSDSEIQEHAKALIGSWTFDESGDGVTDTSEFGHHGVKNNGVAISTGIVQNALSFDGTDDYVSIPYRKTLGIRDQVTLSAWILPFDNTTFSRVIRFGETGLFLKNGYVYFYTNTSRDGGKWTSVSAPVNTRNWYHVVGVYDGQRMKLYINSQLVDTELNSGNINPSNIDEVKMFAQPLTPACIDSSC